MKIYGPLKLGVRSLHFLANANLMNPDDTVKIAELTQMLKSGKAREYRNFGIQSENELRQFAGMPPIK